MSVLLDGAPYLECTDSAYATIPEYIATGPLVAITGTGNGCVSPTGSPIQQVKLINVVTGAFSFGDCSGAGGGNSAKTACQTALDTGDDNIMCVDAAWYSFDGIISNFEFKLGEAFLGATCAACSDAFTCSSATCLAGFSDADGNSANGCTGSSKTSSRYRKKFLPKNILCLKNA
jgi:hypothetical protein